MSEEKWIELIGCMQSVLETITTIKGRPDWCDPRAMAVAATNLETAMLWVANARKDEAA